MRTVTFSDKKVAEVMKESFVATWTNRVPKFHNCQTSTEEHIFKTSPECFATKNFTTFFCTPEKRVLHYFTGYYSPRLFLEELAFVKELNEKSVDATGKINSQRFKELHAKRMQARNTEAAGLEEEAKAGPQTAKGGGAQAVVDWQKNRSLGEGLRHLTKVSEEMAGKGAPTLDKVLKDHLFGNGFTEEWSKPTSSK